MRIRIITVLILLCCLIAAAGCSPAGNPEVTDDSTSASNGGGITDPCALITGAEVEAALGEPVNEPECDDAPNQVGQMICLYETESSSRFVQISVLDTVNMPQTLRDQGQSAVTIYRTTRENVSIEEIPGIGDEAFWGVPGLHVLKGDVYFLIAVGSTDDPENLILARSLAVIVLGRLP